MRKKLKPAEIAEEWGVGVAVVYDHIHSGDLRAIDVGPRVGRSRPRYLVDAEDLEAFERERRTPPPEVGVTVLVEREAVDK